jgi:NAD-dependent deacetylase
VTQNVDSLHERAGSTKVLHVHGELAFARSTGPSRKRYRIDSAPIVLGNLCEDGTQLRPDIVWFGEETQHMDEARELVAAADKVLVVGTSLTVYPAAGLVDAAREGRHQGIERTGNDEVPGGFEFHPGPATRVLPRIIGEWLG